MVKPVRLTRYPVDTHIPEEESVAKLAGAAIGFSQRRTVHARTHSWMLPTNRSSEELPVYDSSAEHASLCIYMQVKTEIRGALKCIEPKCQVLWAWLPLLCS
jgi:hypothetical protein